MVSLENPTSVPHKLLIFGDVESFRAERGPASNGP
jgi:hypothetical protein